MKKIIFVLFLVLFPFLAIAEEAKVPSPPPFSPAASPGPSPLPLVRPGHETSADMLTVADALRIIYFQVLQTPFIFDPAVMADQRYVTFRWDTRKGDIRPFLKTLLFGLGLESVMQGGVELVRPLKEVHDEIQKSFFVYAPVHRDANYLTTLLEPLFSGFTSRRSLPVPLDQKTADHPAPRGSAQALVSQNQDLIIYSGTDREIEQLKDILPKLDTRPAEVLARAVLYEVQNVSSEGSAFKLAASLLQSKLNVNIDAPVHSNSITIKSGSFDAILSAFSTDSRFNTVSQPSLRVRDGATARLTVGQDVPILSSISYSDVSNRQVQSVQYQSSGVIFNLTPRIFRDSVDIDVLQQVSDFTKTDTGVNSSPTLVKRELDTKFTVQDGETVLLGGLTQNKKGSQSSGLFFFPDALRSKSKDVSDSEILLVLQVQRI